MEKIVIKRMSGNKYDDIMSVISKYDEDALDDLEWCYPRCAFVYEDEIEMQEFDPVDFIKYVSSAIGKMDKSSKEYCNLNEFLKSQTIYKYGHELREEFDLTFSNGVLDKVVEILSNKDVRAKFINYTENKEYFYVMWESIGKIQPASMSKDTYIKIMTSMFGEKNYKGELSDNRLYSKFIIPNLEEYKKAYLEMYDVLDFEQYIPKDFRFKSEYISSGCGSILHGNQEQSWQLNQEVTKAINEGMPNNLSPEEKALYVYYKMCNIFLYDEGYMYRDKIQKVNYTDEFSKDHLEKIVPGDKITCYDFSRIYEKVIKNLPEIDVVIISEGVNSGHFLNGISTRNGAVELEAINTMKSGENGDVANDLLRAKLGQKLIGIDVVNGQPGVFEMANQKVYEIFQKQHKKDETESLVEKIKQEPDEELPQSFELCAKYLITNMKKIGIYGNEFSMVFNNVLRKGLFGNNVECAYIGTTEELENNEKRYKRIICICEKEDENFNFYLLDTKSLELTKSSEDYIKNKLNSQEFVYESKKRKINALDR